MLLRLGVVLPPILIAMIGTGCRTVWREPAPTPWTAALARPIVGESGASPPALEAAEEFAANAARAERTGGADATDDYYHSVCSAWAALQQALPGSEAYGAWTTYSSTSLARLLATARDEGRFAPAASRSPRPRSRR